MGVYIKGMEMPKSCWDCPLINTSPCPCKGYSTALEHTTSRHQDCLLVPVPPHGRLIDADAEVEVWDVCGREGVFPHFTTTVSKFLLGHLVGKIPPTIIPAEEGEA